MNYPLLHRPRAQVWVDRALLVGSVAISWFVLGPAGVWCINKLAGTLLAFNGG